VERDVADAEPVALAADILALALCGSPSERRISLLVDPVLSRLPAFLTPHRGINSGFMIPQVTAAALVSENKQMAHPARIDSIPASANQEDHVSMAAHGAYRLHRMARNVANVLAIELLAAAQGCDLRAPLASSPALERVRAAIRAKVPGLDDDRFFAPDKFQGLPARICWVGLGDRHRLGLAFNDMVANGELKAPIVIGRGHLDSGSVASPNRETEAMRDGSDAVSDWPMLNALLNCASGATWVSLDHGGGVGMDFSQHAGMVVVADGTPAAARRLARVLWNDPATGVMRHADAGYEAALDCAQQQQLDLPGILGVMVRDRRSMSG